MRPPKLPLIGGSVKLGSWEYRGMGKPSTALLFLLYSQKSVFDLPMFVSDLPMFVSDLPMFVSDLPKNQR